MKSQPLLFSYYLGSSVAGTGGGFFWSAYGWPGVVVLILLLIGIAALVSRRLVILSGATDRAVVERPGECATEASAK